MMTMNTSHKTIAGIKIGVGDPNKYLRTLWASINESCPELKEALAEIEKELGRDPREEKSVALNVADKDFNRNRVIGYCDQAVLIALADREWIDSEYNEFNELGSYLKSKSLFSSARTVFISGAGVCRLGDYLSSMENIKSVVCSDLSWLTLYLGRLLIQREYHKLPFTFHAPRMFYHVLSDYNALSAQSIPIKFQPPDNNAGQKIRFEVRDAFALIGPPPAELICVPYLLDLFAGKQMKTLLIRLSQALEVGQELLLVSTLVFHPAGERNPQEVIQVLKECGFEINYLDIARLPYTFSYYNYGARKEIWNTLVLKAVKRKETAPSRLRLLTEAEKLDSVNEDAALGEDVRLTWQGKKIILSRQHFEVFQKCSNGLDYSALSRACAGRMTTEEFEHAIGALTSRSLLYLQTT